MDRPSRPVKALIFSVSIGAGHDSVAKALAERLLEEVPGSAAEVVDTFQYINSVLHKVVFGSYIETLKFTPRVWGYLYDQAEKGEMLVDLGQILSKVLSAKLEQLLRSFNPDVIMTSHAFPTGIISVLKQRGQVKVPLGAAVTDFHVHNFWIHQGVDRYFIGAPDLAFNLIRQGIKAERIKATGIPIRSQFSREFDLEETKRKLGLDLQPTVLVAGGGLGMGKIDAIVRELLTNSSFQVVAVTGQNRKLHEALAAIDDQRLKVFGFVENMAEVIAACDLVISKPGGVTTAEVLAMRKPLVIYSSLPGQEDRNTDYLLNRGAAIRVRKLDMLVPEIMSLWSNPLRRRHMLEMADQLGSAYASRLAWEEMWPLLAIG